MQAKTIDVPYFKSGKKLLNCIFDGLKYVVENKERIFDGALEYSEDYEDTYYQILEQLETKFDSFYSEATDFHLSKRNKRLPKILLKAYENVHEYSKTSKGFCIPSPLNILYQMLTVPEEPQSVAYVILFCRSLLYERFKVFPKHYSIPTNYTPFDFPEISSCLDTFLNYTEESKNVHETSDNVRSMLVHYLALKGIFYLRFNNKEGCCKYLESKKISLSNDKNEIKMEFHKLPCYNDLPDTATLINELTGIPIPIKGIDTIFQGGLKTNSKSSLVMRISGQAGGGKTSYALALAAAMSPFGTFSYYISLEEGTEDLTNRLHSLIPEYLKKLSIFNKKTQEWFEANIVPFDSDIENEQRFDNFIEQYLDRIYNALQKQQEQQKQQDNLLPAVCPLMIVIDSIRLFKDMNFEKFIIKCKQLKSLIILISPNEEQFHNNIDYMVDIVINLKHIGTETQEEKPIRILQLLKTRHQAARHGAHVFHLSSKDGIHISPQLPSQIDKKEIIAKPEPSYTYYINFFNEYNNQLPKNSKSPFLPIWDKSQILLHGYGSTGKAGLALTLLLYPLKEKISTNALPTDKDIFFKRKILVISLLYSESYYTNLYAGIRKKYSKIKNAKIDCLCFYSGYFSAEDFVNKIIKKLDAAILEGEPFTGILLDGLHNATLQFPKLGKNNMVWSTLYSLLAKYNLTIVTTYTNFVIDKKNKENEILLEGGEFLLDIMFQAADYSFSVRKSDRVERKTNIPVNKIKKGQYLVTLKSAIRYKINLDDENFIWDREDFILEEYYKESANPAYIEPELPL